MPGTAAPAERQAATESARILVVDDERSMREMLAILLKREGHEVSVAENGRTAIELLNQRPFDLVVSDARMPDLDGLEVLRHARSINPSVIAIMVTAYGSPDLIRGVAQLGVNDYVEKPFNTEVLRFRIRKELDRRRLQQGAGHRRIGHRQGADRARHPRPIAAQRAAVRRRQLRRAHRDAPR